MSKGRPVGGPEGWPVKRSEGILDWNLLGEEFVETVGLLDGRFKNDWNAKGEKLGETVGQLDGGLKISEDPR